MATRPFFFKASEWREVKDLVMVMMTNCGIESIAEDPPHFVALSHGLSTSLAYRLKHTLNNMTLPRVSCCPGLLTHRTRFNSCFMSFHKNLFGTNLDAFLFFSLLRGGV